MKENYKPRATNQFPKKLSQKVNTQAIGQYYKYPKLDGEEVQIFQNIKCSLGGRKISFLTNVKLHNETKYNIQGICPLRGSSLC